MAEAMVIYCRKIARLVADGFMAGWVFRLPMLAALWFWPAVAHGVVYEVGEGRQFSEIGEVPWETLAPGDRVDIHWRSVPYAAKWVIARRGTESQPITIQGVPGPSGQLPVIEGRNARTRRELNYWHGPRSVIKVGGANQPADTYPAWIIIQNLEVRGGRPPFSFTGSGGAEKYAENAAAIFIEKGEHIAIRGCTLHDSALGLGVSAQSREILVENCHLYDNGLEGSVYQHNSYTSAAGMTYQFNRFGPLRAGCPGNNLKDRSAGLTVRGNWIAGGNRLLDLVDAEDNAALRADPRYRETFVYGNVLIKPAAAGSNQLVQYGGDSGRTEWYRKGVLYFYNNTLVSHRRDTTIMFRLATNEERVDCRNNIVQLAEHDGKLALLSAHGVLELNRNWLPNDWRNSHDQLQGRVVSVGRVVGGKSPGFVDEAIEDFRLGPDSACIGAGAPLHPHALFGHALTRQYVRHQSSQTRISDGRNRDRSLDLGAFEFEPVKK